ncbi:MAG: UbiA family prenyltransferase [Elusimicrobia bacterium]|nr:UbiA family prenyltransferase [Elusimicrobiota bacterium]
MRPLVCLATGGAALGGLVILGFPFQAPAKALLTVLTVFLLIGAADAFNDYYDLEIDRINTPGRPIPSGVVAPQDALRFAWALFAAGNLAAWAVGPWMAFSAVVLTVSFTYYGISSKRLGLLKNLLIGFTSAAALLSAGAAMERTSALLWAAGAHIFFMMLAVELTKDVEDMAGDRSCGARTWALSVGAPTATRTAELSVLVGLAAAAAGGAPWPLMVAGAAVAGGAFARPLGLRTPVLILSGSAFVVAGLAFAAV